MYTPRSLPFAALALAVLPAYALGAEVVGVTAANELVTFDTADPARILVKRPITGLQRGEVIMAIDYRGETGGLFAVGSLSGFYRLDPDTGAATRVGPVQLAEPLIGSEFGLDYDGARDVFRVVSDRRQNMRIDPVTGDTVDGDDATPDVQGDATLTYASGDANAGRAPQVTALGTSGSGGAATIYGIDAGLDVLIYLGARNGDSGQADGGQLHTVGALGVDTKLVASLDVTASGGVAFAVLQRESDRLDALYRIDLSTGRATLVGEVGAAWPVRAIAVRGAAGDPGPAPPEPLDVEKLIVKLDFRRAARDQLMLKGTLGPQVGALAGRQITVDVGGVERTFVIDDRGRGRSGSDKIKFAKKSLPNGAVRFKLKLKKADLGDALTDEGLTDRAAKDETVAILIQVVVDDEPLTSLVSASYTAKLGKKAKAKARP